jgi:peptidoglycan LD-endopeptidase CwlK
MTDRNLLDLDPTLQPLCRQFIDGCTAQGIKVGISVTYRSSAEQDAAYAQGRTAPGKIITNAQAGQSPHNCTDAQGDPASKAFDFFIYSPDGVNLDWDAQDPTWQKVIAIGEALGLVSGSTFRFRDNDHMELANWKIPT